MEYVCYCNNVVECRTVLNQFIRENHLSMDCAKLNLIPYKVTLPDDNIVWFVPKYMFSRWKLNRHNFKIIYGKR